MNGDPVIHREVRSDALRPALARRSLRLTSVPYAHFTHIFYLEEGQAKLELEGIQHELSGPALVIHPPDARLMVVIEAGASGHLVGFSPSLFEEAIGDHAETNSLRMFFTRMTRGENLDRSEAARQAPLVNALASELADDGHGSRMAASALLRLILLSTWRICGAEDIAYTGKANAGDILQRFRQLVESHFAMQKPVSFYAGQLGITTDRLHSICRRNLTKTPIQLLHERLTREAKLRLERSTLSVHDISDSLGFHDPTYFSHYFKRQTGLSPAAYRLRARPLDESSNGAASASYADWP
ncbi:MAG: AraC family transcriptional regulator [Allorhizobium sp.]